MPTLTSVQPPAPVVTAQSKQSSASLVTAPGEFVLSQEEFLNFRKLILAKTGIALGDSKKNLVSSRLTKRLRHYGFQTFSEYYDYLMDGMDSAGQADELEEMINRITTNKTDFFRENHHFEFLKNDFIPHLQAKVRQGGPRRLRIWSAACSSGEEPYSIAMSIYEGLGSLSDWDVRILATDLDTAVLQQAETGVYPDERVEDIPLETKRKYFLRGSGQQAGSVRVRAPLQQLITFRRLNFIEEPWPIRAQFDMIFCRNVIIYFNQETQRRLFSRMVTHLKPDGYLCIGHSESLHWLPDLFEPVRNTIYQPQSARPAQSAESAGSAGSERQAV